MENNNKNFDSKENLGHGIKGDISNTANNLKNDKNNVNKRNTNDKSKRNDSIN